jgi:hypothetical protein
LTRYFVDWAFVARLAPWTIAGFSCHSLDVRQLHVFKAKISSDHDKIYGAMLGQYQTVRLKNRPMEGRPVVEFFLQYTFPVSPPACIEDVWVCPLDKTDTSRVRSCNVDWHCGH